MKYKLRSKQLYIDNLVNSMINTDKEQIYMKFRNMKFEFIKKYFSIIPGNKPINVDFVSESHISVNKNNFVIKKKGLALQEKFLE